MSAVEAWLDKNSFFCERHELRLSAAACARYRNEQPARCAGCDVAPDSLPLAKTIRYRKKQSSVTYSRPVVVGEEPTTKPKRVCKVEGCGRKHSAKGYCKNHYFKFIYRPRHLQRAAKVG